MAKEYYGIAYKDDVRFVIAAAKDGINPIISLTRVKEELMDHLIRNYYRHNSTHVLSNAVQNEHGEAASDLSRSYNIKMVDLHRIREEARAALGMEPINIEDEYEYKEPNDED